MSEDRVFQLPAQSRANYEARPCHSGFYPVRSWQPLRMENTQPLCFHGGKVPPYNQVELSSFNLWLLPLYTTVKSLALSSEQSYYSYQKAALRCSFFPRLKAVPSASPERACAPAPWSPWGLSANLFQLTGHSILRCGQQVLTKWGESFL